MKNVSGRSAYFFLILLLSIFPAYNALVNGSAHHHLQHHLQFFTASSDYFNPWQYRVLAPFLAEAFHQLLALPFYADAAAPQAYDTSFKLFRIGQHLLIFGSAWYFFRHFSDSRPLRFLMLVVLAWAFNSAAFMSDFAFNTYFEVLFFTWAAWLLYSGQNRWWFVPLTLLAALNRESSLMLPLLLLTDLRLADGFSNWKRTILIMACCFLVYGLVFFGIRWFYGYQAPAPIGMPTGWPIFRFNLTDPVTLLQLFATLSVIPLFVLFNIRQTGTRLQLLFWLMVPAWFFIHFWLVWARETRIFLVPFTIVLLPMVLQIIQQSFERSRTS